MNSTTFYKRIWQSLKLFPRILSQGSKRSPQFSGTEFSRDFDGWSLFYVKGPNGEQLEFNQVQQKAKENFTQAHNEYNTASRANYSGPNKSNNLAGLSASYSTAINASLQSVWETLLDKMENPGK